MRQNLCVKFMRQNLCVRRDWYLTEMESHSSPVYPFCARLRKLGERNPGFPKVPVPSDA
jgi:hypothetical protein